MNRGYKLAYPDIGQDMENNLTFHTAPYMPIKKCEEAPEQPQNKDLSCVQKGLHEKKDYIEHEVKKAGGAFAKFNCLYSSLICIKSLVLCIYSIYNLFEELETYELIAIFLSLGLAILMLKKAKYANYAIEKRSHKIVKRLLKKALIAASIFAIVYFLWCMNIAYHLAGPQVHGREDVQIRVKKIVDPVEPTIIDMKQDLNKFEYTRLGGPAANSHTKYEQRPKNGRFLPEEDYPYPSKNEKLSGKAAHDAEIKEKYEILYNLPQEIPLILGLVLSTLYFTAKTVLYFSHFIRFARAVQKLEKVEKLIEYFQVQSVNSVGNEVENEDGNDEPMGEPETLVKKDNPIIKEEIVPTLPVTKVKANGNRVYSSQTLSYPELKQPLTAQAPSKHVIVQDMHGNRFLMKSVI